MRKNYSFRLLSDDISVLLDVLYPRDFHPCHYSGNHCQFHSNGVFVYWYWSVNGASFRHLSGLSFGGFQRIISTYMFFWTCAHNIKPKHHLHIKINIRSTWYPLSSIWGEKWNMGQWLSFSKYRRFRHPSNLTDWN